MRTLPFGELALSTLLDLDKLCLENENECENIIEEMDEMIEQIDLLK